MFDKNVFEKAFNAAITSLTKAEKITKATLQDLSRTVLEAHHATQDISYINKLVACLSPMNKRVAILYFKEFSGFNFDSDELSFGKKNKKGYDEAQQKAVEFLEDPNNNIWSWAARNVEVEAKAFTVDQMKKNLEQLLKKAADANIEQIDVVRTFMEAGLKMDTLLALMDEIAGEPAKA